MKKKKENNINHEDGESAENKKGKIGEKGLDLLLGEGISVFFLFLAPFNPK